MHSLLVNTCCIIILFSFLLMLINIIRDKYVLLLLYIGKPLAVIHFDAHCDTWKDHFNEPSGHGNLY